MPTSQRTARLASSASIGRKNCFGLWRGAADHHVGMAQVNRVDAEQAGLGERLPRAAEVPCLALAPWMGEAVGGERVDQVRAFGNVHERALAQRVRHARRVEMAQAAGRQVAHLLSRSRAGQA